MFDFLNKWPSSLAWLAHVLIASAMLGILAGVLLWAGVAPSTALWVGAAFAIAYAYSREKMEFEFELREKAHLTTVGPFWYRGFLPLEWDWPSQLQFYAPALVVALIAYFVTH